MAKTKVILLSFTTVAKPKDVDVFVKAAGRELSVVMKELVGHYPVAAPAQKPSQSESRKEKTGQGPHA